jgi:SAM-dependent methyltransferase
MRIVDLYCSSVSGQNPAKPPPRRRSYSSVMSDKPVQESVWDRLAPVYGRGGPDHFSAFARRLVAAVPLDSDAVVLDLASGTGTLASAVAIAAPAVPLVAADHSVAMLRQSRHVPEGGAGYAVAAMDAQHLACADHMFGTVLCGSALDSFADPAQALAEMHRVLRPGGNLGLWVAPSWWWRGDARWDWHEDLLASLGASLGQVPAGINGPASLRRLIQAAGFGKVRVRADRLDLRFTNADQWWQWAWSHGFRQVLEQLSAAQLRTYQKTAFDRIGPDGIEGRMEALIATATRRGDD